jgi:hypothetical protein
VAKASIIRLVPSGAKLKEVAEVASVTGTLIVSLLTVLFREDPALAEEIIRTIKKYAHTRDPHQLSSAEQALRIIEAIRERPELT